MLKKIEISNFMCFREPVAIELSQSTYLIGVNNAGKTAVLLALRYFFDETIFKDESFLNKTAFTVILGIIHGRRDLARLWKKR